MWEDQSTFDHAEELKRDEETNCGSQTRNYQTTLEHREEEFDAS